MDKTFLCILAGLLLLLASCTRHHVTADTTHKVEIAPIHVTVDINLKVQKALDDALDFQGSLEDIFSEEELKQLQ
ncbi:hypothetical protein [Desulfonatronospira sp.]|uniref:hypothetical protein n=1 Tax=Desulfonatronospira sp. TaxID=1962951 RepID=UPI0025C4DAF4|nr:hypothetical protein [Desulfonatronospira sp.]